MNDETIISQVPHGARFVLVPSDFPKGEGGTIAYRQQLVNYFNRDVETASRYKARPLRISGKHTIRQVYNKLNRVLEREGLIDEYFNLSYFLENGPGTIKAETLWSEIGFRNISVWPATGTNEGVYVHVEFVGSRADWNQRGPMPRYGFATCKTWQRENAFKVARRIVELLGA